MKNLTLSNRDTVALKSALDLFIRLGLGQVSAVSEILEKLLNDRISPELLLNLQCELNGIEVAIHQEANQMELQDKDTSSLVVAAFGLRARLDDNTSAFEWASRRLHENADME